MLFGACETVEEQVVEIPEEVAQVEVIPESESKDPYIEIGESMTKPEPKKEIVVPAPQPPKEEPKPEEVVVATFGEVKITQKDYVDTKAEMQKIVNDLNNITETESYERWLDYLSEDYKIYYSNKQTLREISEKLPIKGIRLNTLKDYFTYVFVPARKNIRVDDIKFISASTVEVLMRDRGRLLLVYSLENQSDGWKLVRNQASRK